MRVIGNFAGRGGIFYQQGEQHLAKKKFQDFSENSKTHFRNIPRLKFIKF